VRDHYERAGSHVVGVTRPCCCLTSVRFCCWQQSFCWLFQVSTPQSLRRTNHQTTNSRTAHKWSLKRWGQARSRGRAPLFLVSKKTLNPSYWNMWRTKNRQEWIRMEKVMAPQSRGSRTQKNKPPNTTKFKPYRPKNSLYVALFLLKFQDDL
jgi:hypothetical protein